MRVPLGARIKIYACSLGSTHKNYVLGTWQKKYILLPRLPANRNSIGLFWNFGMKIETFLRGGSTHEILMSAL